MIRCCRCKCIFDDEDADYDHECVGEFWGSPAYQDYPKCPECGSDDLEDFEYPSEKCLDQVCDYECEDCPYAQDPDDE